MLSGRALGLLVFDLVVLGLGLVVAAATWWAAAHGIDAYEYGPTLQYVYALAGLGVGSAFAGTTAVAVNGLFLIATRRGRGPEDDARASRERAIAVTGLVFGSAAILFAGGAAFLVLGLLIAAVVLFVLLIIAFGSAGSPGRPLRVAGRTRTASAGPHPGWTTPIARRPPGRPEARYWTRVALGEHASVASFARISLDLIAAGAPSDLIERAHRAALDEIRHARLSFGLAGGGGPGPLPSALAVGDTRPIAVRIGVEALTDGMLLEGWYADELTRSAAAERDPAVRAALDEMASDESGHGAFAEALLVWALGADEAAVAAIEHALARLPRLPPALLDPGPGGVVDRIEAFTAHRARVVDRVTTLLAQSPAH